MNSEKPSNINRRNFVKGAGAFALTGASLSAETTTATSPLPPFITADANMEHHICQGLNMKTEQMTDANGNKKSYTPGTAPGPNVDQHGCSGGNNCAGLGGCGTGDYNRQYWVTDNTCGQKASDWNGNGGCGAPIGHGNSGFIHRQLNSAAPTKIPSSGTSGSSESDARYPADFFGNSIWSIARSRFETKMVSLNKGFGAPSSVTSSQAATQSWTPGSPYTRPSGLPDPYPKPWPPRAAASNPPKTKKKNH